jgi:hypothetical protein
VRAAATDLEVALHDAHAAVILRGSQRRPFTGRTAAYHDDIELFHYVTCFKSWLPDCPTIVVVAEQHFGAGRREI